jgi:hypothetical protein
MRPALSAVLLLGCSGPPGTVAPSGSCDPVDAVALCERGDEFACRWGSVFAGRGELAALAPLVEGSPPDLDELLRALFPAIGTKPIVDEEIRPIEGVTYVYRGGEPYVLPVPIVWDADPYGDSTWRLYFQSLDWLEGYLGGDASAVDAAVYVLSDWVERALYASPSLDYTFRDHAMSIRLRRAAALVDRYIADRPVLNRRFLHAAAQLIAVHLYAMATEACYPKRHNHGVFIDLAILGAVHSWPALVDGGRLWELARRRLIEEQVRASVTSDGIHVENSPSYHLLFVQLLTGAIGTFLEAGEAPPDELVKTRDRMIEPLVQLMQPDGSFAQFGETTDRDRRREMRALVEVARAQGIGDATALDMLGWAAYAGALGRPPVALNRIYEIGGYAAFHDRWAMDGDAIAAHFKASHLSAIHDHADETSFEIFGHGHDLIVGRGYYTYVNGDPRFAYAASNTAANVLVIDDVELGPGPTDARSRIVDHGVDGEVVWVDGMHARYRDLGVDALVRTFAWAPPDAFAVIDHIAAPEPHRYSQHFHLHPDLGRVLLVDERTVVATTGDGAGPSVALVSADTPDAVELAADWYFPDFGVSLASTEVVVHRRRAAGELDHAVVIVVSPPGVPARIPTDVSYVEAAGRGTTTWTIGGVTRAFTAP